MKRRLLFLLVVLSLLLSVVAVTAPAQAATVTKGRVSVFRLSLRADASVQSSRVAVLRVGESVTILGQKTVGKPNQQWFRVQTSSGKMGWVRSTFVKLTTGKMADIPTLP